MSQGKQAPTQFAPARAKLWIGSLDQPGIEIRAQYNPKELQVDKQIKWEPHKGKESRTGDARKENSKQADLEFNGAPTRSLTVELLFDGYEAGRSIQGEIAILEELSSATDPESPNEALRRPHHCVVAWGDAQEGMRPFRCVIESLGVKYSMWNSNGVPLRATCTVKLTEAVAMSAKAAPESTNYTPRAYDAVWSGELAKRERQYSETTQRQIDERRQPKKL